MKKPRLTKNEINTIISLRKRGNTLDEIRKLVPRGRTTIFAYIKDVIPYKKFALSLEDKKHGTKKKAEREWVMARELISEKLGQITKRGLILMAGMLYWAEGTKHYDLNLINTDSGLMKIFLKGLLALGVSKEHIKISIRLFSDLNEEKAIKFWLKELNLTRKNLVSINYLKGKKKGKLPYGMCRLRVKNGALHFKQLMSIMNLSKMLP
ncbi:MAG: hypothetical protein US18_C0013G0001 [Parcubacteria group bacterium GW2011_GWB1_36_5]|nr:MAG: hypothetical protein US18_C0013G0001 [Parcubacteria group bacterium GW2011_GWB1_36_5]